MTARITESEAQALFPSLPVQRAPRKRRKKSTPESAILSAAIKWLHVHGCFVWRNNTGCLPDQFGRRVKFGFKGSADIIGLTPSGRFLGVETKAPGRDLTDDQRRYRNLIQEKGGIYIVCRRLEDLEKRKGEILA